jgi:chromosome segregation ATPase
MAEDTVDLYSLSERIKRAHGDVRALRTESAQTRADLCRLRGKVVGVRADITRVEMRLDAFAEGVDDRFEQTVELIRSSNRALDQKINRTRDDLTQKIDRIRDDLSEKIDRVRDEMIEKIDRIESKIDQLRR